MSIRRLIPSLSMSSKAVNALVSLNNYSDSEPDSDTESNDIFGNVGNVNKINDRINDLTTNLAESRTNSPSNAFLQSIDSLDKSRRESITELISDTGDEVEDNADCRPNSPVSYHKSLIGKTDDQILIPSEPQEKCAEELQQKIQRLHEKMKMGSNMTTIIQKRKDFRNPSIYEKLIAYCGIDEMATNYPPDVYDPHVFTEKAFYEELAKRQKDEMEKRERERKDRTKVEFISGTKKGQNSDSNESTKKKSKWDLPNPNPTQIGIVRPQIVIPVTVASGTKPTVISAFGTISKKSK